MKTISKIVLVLLLFTLFTVGCGLFRKKNRCHTCPAWDKTEIINEKPVHFE